MSLQRAARGVLRALRSAQPAAAARSEALAALQQAPAAQSLQQQRAYSLHAEPVAPAATHRDIKDEWYLRQRQLVPLGNRVPHVAVGVYIAPSAVVLGDVDILDRVSLWNNVVLRGDLNNITVGPVTNIQDRTVVHAARSSPTGLSAATNIGKYVTVEPGCVLRSCSVGDYCRVGARSVLLEGSMMEPHSALAPGSVLPPARRVPAGELWGGAPARFVRKLSADEQAAARSEAEAIRELAWEHEAESLPHGTAWRPVEEQRAALVKSGAYAEVDLRRAKYELRKELEVEASNAQLTLEPVPGGKQA